MEYIKIRFLDDFGHIGSKFEKTIEDMFRSMSPAFTLAERSWKPPMDMNETPEEIIIIAEVPGVEKDDLDVEISSKLLIFVPTACLLQKNWCRSRLFPKPWRHKTIPVFA